MAVPAPQPPHAAAPGAHAAAAPPRAAAPATVRGGAELPSEQQALGASGAAAQQQQQQAVSTAASTSSSGTHAFAGLIAERFPPITYGFAYGSGVFAQPDLSTTSTSGSSSPLSASSSGSSRPAAPGSVTTSSSTTGSSSRGGQAASQPMIDFIFVVDDPTAWHAANMEVNSSHYSAMRHLGPGAVAAAAERLGAGVYFNTLVPFGGRLIKYGVTSTACFLDDVTTWRHLYVPGRLHKPVAPLLDLAAAAAGGAGRAGGGREQAAAASSSGGVEGSAGSSGALQAETAAQLAAALGANHAAALQAALLLSPEAEVPLRDLLRRLVGLSYHGDVRMGLAEDSKKVEKIVAGSWRSLCDIYLPLLEPVGASGGAWAGGGSSGGWAGGCDGGSVSGRLLGAGSAGGGGGGPPAAAYAAVQHAAVGQDVGEEARTEAMSRLPAALLARVARKLGIRRPWAEAAAMHDGIAALATSSSGGGGGVLGGGSEVAAAAGEWRRDVAWAAVRSGRHAALLHGGLGGIIRASSARQAALGLLSAGAVKSARYLGAKLAKAWR